MSDKPEARVTPERNVSERRKRPRKKSLLQATLVTANGSCDCRVLDFWPGGARVEFAHPLAIKVKVTLILRPIGTFAGVVVWCGSGCFGMQFLEQTSRAGAAAVLSLKAPAQLAAYLLAKQGARSSAEPDAPSSTDAAPVSDNGSGTDDARSLVVLKADLVADLRRFVDELRTLMGYQDADDSGAPTPTR
jgi:PilZ domain-containing protein